MLALFRFIGANPAKNFTLDPRSLAGYNRQMAKNIFFISDTHFGHEAPYNKFLKNDKVTLLRPHGSAEAGDTAMVENWNRVVKPDDRVYHLGDVTMSHKASALEIFRKLNGKKVLIKGNHDVAKLSAYAEHFNDVRSIHHFDGVVITHVPLHPGSLSRWGTNVHGHTHANSVTDIQGNKDPRYLCVSVEQINYTPISLEQVKKLIKEQQC